MCGIQCNHPHMLATGATSILLLLQHRGAYLRLFDTCEAFLGVKHCTCKLAFAPFHLLQHFDQDLIISRIVVLFFFCYVLMFCFAALVFDSMFWNSCIFSTFQECPPNTDCYLGHLIARHNSLHLQVPSKPSTQQVRCLKQS